MLKDKMAEIGKILRMERVARGLELHEVSKKARVSWYYLKAIEEGRYHVIPRLYDVGYIRMYAEFLDADAKHLLARCKRERDNPPN
jgi:cytoskeleton protein RodZ